jgi:hypothetical protein
MKKSTATNTSPSPQSGAEDLRNPMATLAKWAGYLVFVLGFAVLLTSCTTRLRDNFELYPDGQPIGGGSEGIPGDPKGDHIYAFGSSKVATADDPNPAACNDELFSVSTADPLSGQKSLVLQDAWSLRCNGSCSSPVGCQDPVTLIFEPNVLDNSDQPVLFVWQGQFFGEVETSVVSISIKQDLGSSLASLLEVEVKANELLAGSSTVSSASNAIAFDFTRPHRVLVTVSPELDTWAVQLSAEGLPTPTSGAVQPCSMAHVLCDAFTGFAEGFDPSTLVMVVKFDDDSIPPSISSLNPVRYRMDGVTISQRPL